MARGDGIRGTAASIAAILADAGERVEPSNVAKFSRLHPERLEGWVESDGETLAITDEGRLHIRYLFGDGPNRDG